MRAVRDIDPRTDVWSLGVILFELLAGRPPFLGESVPELCATMLRDEPPPLSLFRADVPPSLERVILRCLAKDRERRYATVAEIAQDLVEFAPQHRVHAERAIGVVRAANARLSMSGGEIGRGSTRLLATPAPSSQPSNLATASGSVPGVTSERSPTSPDWTESGSAKPNRARVVALGAAGAALLGLITASILLARSSGEPAEVTTNGSDASAAARPAAPPVVTPIVTNPTAAPAGDSVTSSGASGSAPSASAPKPSRPRAWKPSPPPATTAAPAPASPPPADGLPDFGGRR
jgi:serine/threonine protein kinase